MATLPFVRCLLDLPISSNYDMDLQMNPVVLEVIRKICVFVCNPALVDITGMRKSHVRVPIRQ